PFNNNISYGNSHYQNPPQQTQENKIEAMLDQVLERQQKLTVDFNGKLDSIYKDLDTKIETLGTQVRKLETQVLQNTKAIKRQEGDKSKKHHVKAILDDDFWQEIRHVKWT